MGVEMVKRNQQLKLFLTLLLCTAFILAFSHFGSSTFETYSVTSNTFKQGTKVGSIDLSGVPREKAVDMVTTKVEEWHNQAKIELHYREKKQLLDSRNFSFDIRESIELARSGVGNPLLVQVNKDEWQNVINQINPSFQNTEDLEAELLQEIKFLKKEIVIKLDQFLGDNPDIEVLSSVSVQTDLLLPSADKISTIPLPAGGSFSLSNFLSESKVINNTSTQAINLLSSSIYQLIVNTNFTIQERHIGSDLPDGIPLGFEAKIDDTLGWDLVFTNPNSNEFSIAVSQQVGYFQIDLLGYPFANSYQTELKNNKILEPKTIQYKDPLLLPGETKEKYSGKNGFYVEVFREVLGEKGEWLNSELISKDFYAPQHRIVLMGY
jgi:hypothetical protein